MLNGFRRIVIGSWALLALGCVPREPVVEVRRLIPAGDHVLMEVVTATHVGGYGQEQTGGRDDDETAYLLSLPVDRGTQVSPDRGGPVAWPSQWPATCWGEPFVRASPGGTGVWPAITSLEPAESLRWAADKRGWVAGRTWTAPQQRLQAFVPSSDGRYLVVRSPAFQVIDVKTLQPLTDQDGSLRRTFDRAQQLGGAEFYLGRMPYALTRQLNYLAVPAPWRRTDEADVRQATEIAANVPFVYGSGAGRIAIVERRTGKVVAAPGTYGENGHMLACIDETDAGELRLLYTAERAGAYQTTLCDDHYHILARDAVGPIWDGRTNAPPAAVLDAGRHCVWFYAPSLFRPSGEHKIVSFRRWDYLTGRIATFTVNLDAVLRPGGANFVYAPRTSSRRALSK